MEAVYQWMKTIVYFLLFLGVFKNLISQQYQKYTRLAVGLCLVLLVASPVISFLTKGDFSFFDGAEALESFSAEYAAADGDELWESVVRAEYEKLLTEQIDAMVTEEGYAVDQVTLEMEAQEVTGMTVVLRVSEATEAVETISITEIVVRLDREKETERPVSVQELAIRKKLADFYGCEASHIYVLIEEDQNS